MNQPPGPRFTGPARARPRVRLLTAVAVLAITAVGVGGLASLAQSRPAPRPASAAVDPIGTTPANGAPDPSRLIHHSARLEHEVREAEQAVTRARAAITSARRLGNVDPALLLEFDRRLERLGESPLESVRRSYESWGSSAEELERQGRSNLRSIATPARDL
ncbi:hypothetical protein [Enhygromyxa salina]|uniref:Uncharacterized protein n=1 Tax=Enhygromyxa salina TaxID=215803 RepID=A0A2S9YP29_9BACT|nr:hypothetical protein [Enhygromyxa salina]PRQ06845.1 hypothetical protein ENSA7_34550 [Enhygromyxa salina]